MINHKVSPVEKMAESPVNNKRLKFNQNKNFNGHIVVNFVHVFRPIYYFARFFGQMPFSIVQIASDEFHQPRIRKWDFIWFTISICMYTVLTVFNSWYIFRASLLFRVNKILYLLAWTISTLRFVNFLCALVMLIMDVCNRHRLVNILNKFTAFDRKVKFS